MDVVALVRVAKQQVRLATRGMDRDGSIELYLEELPVETSTRGRPGQAGRGGFYSYQGAGDVGRVVVNVGVCYDEERFMKVLYHELAHAVERWLHGDAHRPHGETWQAVMRQLGQEPTRCHPYRDRK